MQKKHHGNFFKDYSVLYVEDDMDTRQKTKVVLSCIFGDVYEASDAKEAMQVFLKYSPDIAIVDIGLPGKNGLDLIKQMRQLNPSEPFIVIVSSSSSVEHLQAAIPLRLEGYIFKPLRVNDLLKALNGCVKVLSERRGGIVHCENGAVINLNLGETISNGIAIKLTRKEFELIELFVANKGNYIHSSVIEVTLWPDKPVSSGALKMLIKQLRTKLGNDAIENLINIGYRLKI